MISLDPRAGSRDLYPYLSNLHMPVHMDAQLDYGDFSFLGNGPDGPVGVGVEMKTIGDVLKCMTDGRFAAHQLPGLLASYQVCWLLMIGEYRTERDSGILQVKAHKGYWFNAKVGNRAFMSHDLDAWLTTMTCQTRLRVWRVYDLQEAAHWAKHLYGWWTKEWQDHKSLKVFDNSGDGEVGLGNGPLYKPSLERRIAAQLPGIGWIKSGRVVHRFPTVELMTRATEEEWMEVEGVGRTIAHRIVNQLHGLKNGTK